PQSLVGSLIDIAQLKDITYYPANHRCAHWAVYSEDQTELLCPCAPAERTFFSKTLVPHLLNKQLTWVYRKS
ncbi:hypothetical protein, partial [Segatella oulorum]|uniref:hypothetical protein n=1 Tax=Segatella oulorum TaxID=28136 RepID=UPI003617168A